MTGPDKASGTREHILDLSKLTFDGGGIHGFLWPLARKEQQAQRDTTLKTLVELLRPGLAAGDHSARLLAMCIHWTTNEAQMLFRATALSRRVADAGLSMSYSPDDRLLHAVSQSRLPSLDEGPYVRFLMKGPAAHGAVVGQLAKLKRSLVWNGPGWRGMRSASPQTDIMACHRTPLLDLRAQASSEVVKQTHLQEWFAPPRNASVGQPPDSTLVARAVDAIRKGYEAGGETLPEYQAEYFAAFLEKIGALLSHYYSGLERRRSALPRVLWTGSGGYIYARMLRNAVRADGGYVVGHEHGAGEAHIGYFSAKPFIEYESADEFVTYSEDGAEALRTNFAAELHLRDAPPVIRSSGKEAASMQPAVFGRVNMARLPVLMYPTTCLMGERVTLDHIVGDYVMVDWSVRLMSNLREMGYEVIHKPHPEEARRSPRRYVEQFGVRQTWEKFEDVQDAADVFILDFSRTSIFPVALASNKPVVYIDFGFERWHSRPLELLRRRARIVKGWVGPDNRLDIDWQDLRRAVTEAWDLPDREIITRYYPHLSR